MNDNGIIIKTKRLVGIMATEEKREVVIDDGRIEAIEEFQV